MTICISITLNIRLSEIVVIMNTGVPFVFELGIPEKQTIIVGNVQMFLAVTDNVRKSQSYKSENFHFLEWGTDNQTCTYTELQNLHRKFPRPRADKFFNLLKPVLSRETDASTRAILEYIWNWYLACQTSHNYLLHLNSPSLQKNIYHLNMSLR